MRLIVGLGNPGPRYAGTRHNVGFRVLAELAARANVAFARIAGRYETAIISTDDGPVNLLRPLTYMNRSGDAVRAWAARNDVQVTGAANEDDASPAVRPLVVCDDLALPLGALRLRERGSAGGQKGLVSIIAAIGGEEFPRVRLGIGDPAGELATEAWSDFVLEEFPPEQDPVVAELVRYAADAVAAALTHGVAWAASRFNRRHPPTAGETGSALPETS